MAETDYTKRTERKESGTDPRELPEAVAREVIKDVELDSVALRLCNVKRMSTRQERLTLLDSFPQAYWDNGNVDYPALSSGDGVNNASGSARAVDSQPSRTTKVTWDAHSLAAERLSVMVPIPNDFIDDTGAPLFDEIRPLLVTAFAKKIDGAVFFGTDSPFTLTGGIVGTAIDEGNYVPYGGTADLGSDIAALGLEAAEDGIDINGFVAGPGFKWRLAGVRSDDGVPIFQAGNLAQGIPDTVYGLPYQQVHPAIWAPGPNQTLVVSGDFEKAVVGIRRDITFELSRDAVIYDPATQKVTYSARQQHGTVLVASMRVAFTVVRPLLHATNDNTFPFYTLTPLSGT